MFWGLFNRLFASLMSWGVMLLVGVRETQGVLSSWEWWVTQQGRVQEKKLGLTSGPGSAAPWYPGVHGCTTNPEEDVQWHSGICSCATTPEDDRSQFHIT